MVKQNGGNIKRGGMGAMGAPGMGAVGAPGMGAMGAPGMGAMGAPGMGATGAPGMGSSFFGLGQLANQDPYRNNAMTGNPFSDYNHGAMNGLGSMLGAQPRFHVLPELAQELSSLLYNQQGLSGLGNAMMPYQGAGYGSMFSPQGGYGSYGLFGGKKLKNQKHVKLVLKNQKSGERINIHANKYINV